MVKAIWKGQASYRSLDVDGEVNVDAPWFDRDPKQRAMPIQDYCSPA